MKFTTKGVNLIKTIGYQLVIPVGGDNELSKISPDIEYEITIQKKKNKRSLNASAYCWVLCQKIAEELSKSGYTSKEDVYRKAIKDCSHFSYVPVREDAIERYIQIWQGHGLGWLAEDAGECQSLKGYHNIMCYHGSSVYNTKEMARLIDCLTDECEQLGIKLEPSEYIQSLVEGWESEQSKEKG
nr:MAG TPA: NinB protein [Caudoviricetes sp.]